MKATWSDVKSVCMIYCRTLGAVEQFEPRDEKIAKAIQAEQKKNMPKGFTTPKLEKARKKARKAIEGMSEEQIDARKQELMKKGKRFEALWCTVVLTVTSRMGAVTDFNVYLV